MFSKKVTLALVAIVAAMGAGAVSAKENNPLHPSYYMGRVTVVKAATTSADFVPYVSNNPLHPTYSKVSGASWIATGKSAGTTPYVDTRNPLHPMFKRS